MSSTDASAPPAPSATPDAGVRLRWLDIAVRVAQSAAAAPGFDAALQSIAALLGRELGCGPVASFRVGAPGASGSAITWHGQTPRDASEWINDGGCVARALHGGLPLIDPVAGLAVVPLVRNEQAFGGVVLSKLDVASGRADGEGLAAVLELTRNNLLQVLRREPAGVDDVALIALSKAFAETIDDSLFITNPERTQFHFLTRSLHETWGMTAEQFAARPDAMLEQVIAEDRPLIRQRMERERAGESVDLRFRIAHPTKGLRWLRSRTRSRVAPDGSMRVYGWISDITAERQREAELEGARDAALAASQAKSQFMANMSHEIRTPMNGILGMTELLLGTPLSEQQRRFAQAVYGSGESLLEIINDILDFSKMEAGKLELAPSDFVLRAVAEDTLELLAPRAHAKGLELNLIEEPGLPELVHADGLRLRQVLTNLIANAIKFTEHGEVWVEMRRARNAASDAPGAPLMIEFLVRDTGIGIPASALPKLFDSFTQGNASASKRYGGTGLGLAIVRQLVELMGGQVGVKSAPGIGSEFAFTLPLAASVGSPTSTEPDVLETAGLRVLVVDDNETNRCVLENMLGAWGMEVTLAEDGQQALELLLDETRRPAPFDVALIDMRMPRLDGLGLALAWREARPQADMKMIMLSSASSPDDVRVAHEAGFDRFIAKPLRKAELRRAIQGVAASQRETPEGPASFAGNVLVVEDNGVNQQVIGQMLRTLGCQAHLASGAIEGLRALCEKRFDLVLMDIQMPGMDGIDALRWFRRGPGARFPFVNPPTTPVVAVTANALAGDETRLREIGFDDYLSKPFRRSQLLAMLTHHLKPGAPLPKVDAPAPGAAATPSPTSTPMPQPAAPGVLDAAALARLRELDPKDENHLMQRVLTAFQTSTSRLVPQVREAARIGDKAGVRHVAHTLKSSSASVGALRLAQMCTELEAMVRSDQIEDLENRVAAMCDEVDIAMNALQQLLGARP